MTLPPPEDTRPGESLTWTLSWGIAFFDLLIIALATWTLIWNREQVIERAEMTTQNLAHVLEQNLLGTVRQIDMALLSVKDEVERDGRPLRPGWVEDRLQLLVSRLQILEGLQIADAQGRLLHGAGFPGAIGAGVAIGDRDYFRTARDQPGAGLVISQPLTSRVTGRPAVVFARRLEGPSGAFRGVICGVLPLERLRQLFAELDVGRRGSISLRGSRLDLLVRFPHFPGLEQALGSTTVDGDYRQAVDSGQAITRYTAPSRLDGQVRTYTFRRTADPTFFILVGLAREDYLEGWRREALLAVLATAGLVSLSLAIAWMARRAWRQQADFQASIENQEAKFRLLAENAEDVIWTTDLEGRLTYISPGVLRQRGFLPEEIQGAPVEFRYASAGEGDDPRRAFLDRALAAAPWTQPFEGERFEGELFRKDGGRFRGEIRLRLVWGPEGRLLGFQGVTRDITERARLEAARDQLIQELTQALAEVKQLSGMLPICSSCKKVRDDRGYWNQIETYLAQRTEATFTHGVCPDCAAAFRQEMQARREQQGEG